MKLPKGVVMRFGINFEGLSGVIILLIFGVLMVFQGTWLVVAMVAVYVGSMIFVQWIQYMVKKKHYVVSEKRWKKTPKHFYLDFYGEHK